MPFTLDEQSFVEHYHPNYNCQDIADEGDIALVLDGEWRYRSDEENEGLEEYLAMSPKELEAERKRLWRKILEDTMQNYLDTHYPENE